MLNYRSDIIPGGQVSAAALEELATGLNDNTYTWNVNLAAQTSITVKITDSKGTIAYSSLETIQPGSSTACLNSTASATAGGAARYATTAGGSSTAAVAGTSTSAVSSTAATS